MIERDEELNRLLRRWESPAPGANLDARVWSSYRQLKGGKSMKKWLPIAAGIVIVAGLARLWLPAPNVPPKTKDVSLSTTMDAAGFRAVPNGSITVVKVRTTQ